MPTNKSYQPNNMSFTHFATNKKTEQPVLKGTHIHLRYMVCISNKKKRYKKQDTSIKKEEELFNNRITGVGFDNHVYFAANIVF